MSDNDSEILGRSDFDRNNIERSSERGGIITARGTGDGLILRLDGRVDRESLRSALMDFMRSRSSFVSGNEVSLEWVGRCPDDTVVAELSEDLHRDFKVIVKSSELREKNKPDSYEENVPDFQFGRSASGRASKIPQAASKKPSSLFDGIDIINQDESARTESGQRPALAGDSFLWDDPDARIIYSTLRSGQRLETDHSVVIFGDVNSGAEIVAGGDIVVLGILRGVAHAGAYDETGGGRRIFALNLQPTQLRIGMIISRGSSESQNLPEIARVEGNLIVVEAYQARGSGRRKS